MNVSRSIISIIIIVTRGQKCIENAKIMDFSCEKEQLF